MSVEWNIPFTLTSPYGEFAFNAPGSTSQMVWVLDPTKCSAFRGIRQTSDPRPQSSGKILHRKFADGYSMRLGGWVMKDPDGQPACGEDLRVAWEEAQLHLNALLGADIALTQDNAELAWTPTGYGQDRRLRDIRLFEELTPTFDPEGGPVEFSFAVESPFPYAVDENETVTALDATIVNPGNCYVFPNFQIDGPATTFTILNVTTGQLFIYDSGFPAAVPIDPGDYAFLGCFANNIYLNGDQVNLMAGVDFGFSEFFALAPGTNELELTDATGSLIWTPGWV